MTRTIGFIAVLLIVVPTLAGATPARPHHRPAHVAQAQPLIACTVLGCAPVRPECTAAPGRTFSGMPTGHDIVICPPGVQPFR
jgi:hypothetical protein